MNETVRIHRDGAVATLALNRPAALNAMNGEMMAALRDATQALAADDAIRAVVLRGEGPAFLAGGDVKLFHQHVADLPELILSVGPDLNAAIVALRAMPKPVLASVHGSVAGAGVSLMLAADLVIAAGDTRFNLAYTKIGVNPDGGSTAFLPRVVGEKKAMELVLLAETFDAEGALRLGLINWAVPAAELAQRTAALATRLAAGPTRAYGEAKALMYGNATRPLPEQLAAEIAAFARCAATADAAEGIAAFVEKRAPRFTGH
ncbi:MAG TPA: enoyl-CoA hydratase-related protein [Pelomicrobium sp.]|nr:enoyl-CoA hydratase-related protein [Pelomicrobium sp.]